MRVTKCKVCYRHSCQRLLALRGNGAWEAMFQELKDKDVQALNERERNKEETAEHERLLEMAKLQTTEGDVDEGKNYGVSLGEGH
jgi:hypothetical protein